MIKTPSFQLIAILLASMVFASAGCRTPWNSDAKGPTATRWYEAGKDSESSEPYEMPFSNRAKPIYGASNNPVDNSLVNDSVTAEAIPQTKAQGSFANHSTTSATSVVRGQDPGSFQNSNVVQASYQVSGGEFNPGAAFIQSSQSNQQDGGGPGGVSPATYQYPELGAQGVQTPFLTPSERIGSPNELNPLVYPYPPSGSATFPRNYLDQNYADLVISASEGQTGRINLGGAYNSENGLVGQFIIDERNFDITRFPRGFRDIRDGTAWRGAGQGFRMELVPGNLVQRYMVNFTEPYLFDTNISFSLSGFYFTRNYFDWNEQRLGGRFAFGYRLTPDLSVSLGLRMEDVKLFDPRVNTSQQLNDSLGSTDLFMATLSIVNDTRDHPFLPTDGTFTSLSFTQAFGEVSFPRADLEWRKYHLIYERMDRSGRHTLSYGTKLGFSGSDTPIFENYFAGGFSTMRGFDFRGMGPVEGDVRVGGPFQWISSVEYMFPLTHDDMIRGVAFVDFGTVEESVKLNWDSFRIAPGLGLRVHLPMAGMGGAPLAFDFAFPVNKTDADDRQIFSFYMGFTR